MGAFTHVSTRAFGGPDMTCIGASLGERQAGKGLVIRRQALTSRWTPR